MLHKSHYNQRFNPKITKKPAVFAGFFILFLFTWFYVEQIQLTLKAQVKTQQE